jgi:hypothetical protein
MQLELEQIASHCNQSVHLPRPEEEPMTSANENTAGPPISHNQSPTRIASRWNAPLPPKRTPSIVNRYPANLTPNPSPLRPMCAAADRLRLWKPVSASTNPDPNTQFPEEERERVKDLLANAWQESTRASYATGLLTYHVFCDQKSIDEVTRAPASSDLIIAFISAMAGSLAGSTINNYISGIKSWHVIHNIPWNVDQLAVDAALRAATVSTPSKSTKPPREPITVSYLSAIINHLTRSDPLDAAIIACLTTTFWSVSRLGEFTVQTIKSFSVKKHITMSATALDQDRNGLQVRTFRIPFTKVSREKGETTSWAQQPGPTDPWEAFENHQQINAPAPNTHIFAYKTNRRKALTPLTKRKVIERVRSIALANDLPIFEGHGLRIGGTLEYLLRGIPFEVVRSMGRWKSDAFQLYLREHAQILAPYLQANPVMNLEFGRIAMPPPR